MHATQEDFMNAVAALVDAHNERVTIDDPPLDRGYYERVIVVAEVFNRISRVQEIRLIGKKFEFFRRG